MLFKHKEKPELFKQWLQAYMACVAFIDDQVGTVLDALEASPYADNTVVVLTSDHGFHVGGKEALYKQIPSSPTSKQSCASNSLHCETGTVGKH